MEDHETETLWNHVTGEAIHGPLSGADLAGGNLLQMNVRQAIAMDSEIQVAISGRPYASSRRLTPDNLDVAMPRRFISTLGREDTRRPRMDIGLGVWLGGSSRYYSMEAIRQKGNAFIDEFGGRQLMVYIQPESATPAAPSSPASATPTSSGNTRLGTRFQECMLTSRNRAVTGFSRLGSFWLPEEAHSGSQPRDGLSAVKQVNRATARGPRRSEHGMSSTERWTWVAELSALDPGSISPRQHPHPPSI